MKKDDYYYFKNNSIHFLQSDNSYSVEGFKSVTVRIKPVLKNTWNTILNATANAMTSSMANGNEKVQIIIDIVFEQGKEEILMNEQLLVRGNLDYYEMMEHAKRLRNAIKKDMQLKRL